MQASAPPRGIRAAYVLWPQHDHLLRERVANLTPEQLVDGLARTFQIVERCLDTWTFDRLEEVIRRPDWGPGWVRTRGEVVQRRYAHDRWHIAELHETLTRASLAPINLWE